MKRVTAIILAAAMALVFALSACAEPAKTGVFGFMGTSGDGSVLLKWDYKKGTEYSVNYKRTDAESWKKLCEISGGLIKVKGLKNGVNYDFYISAGKAESEAISVSPSKGKKTTVYAKESRTGFGSTEDFVAEMGVGINLGNTFDATGDWFAKTPTAQETAWGSPVVTEKMIKGYADAGFGVMRLPVSWTVLADSKGNIPDDFLDRIEEVVGWILDSGMKCILNSHHDGWPEKFQADFDGTLKIYANIWKQISDRFKDCGENLMFESMNEVGFDNVWNQYGGTQGKDKAFDMFKKINQKFVDTVRASGGNNSERHLLIASYWTNIDHACCKEFSMPNDPAGRCAISVHYYTPSTFCILEEDADWGKARPTWGTEDDYKELYKYMDMMADNFVEKGIPVIIGEFGCSSGNKTRKTVENWVLSVAEEACKRDMVPVLWDTPGGEYDREKCKFSHPDFIKKLVKTAK